MIKFVVARYEGDVYDTFLGPCVDGKYEVAQVFDGNGIYEKYNAGISALSIANDDIVIFCHGDVKIIDPDFEDKVLFVFDTLPKLGVAGVIGATELHETAGWWLSDRSLHRGHVMQWVDGNEKNKYHMVKTKGNYNNICVVDGLCVMVRGELVNKLKFDTEVCPGSYNFYEYDYCLDAKWLGYEVGVFDILLEHKSAGEGIHQDDWKNNKELFLTKWKNRGLRFPLR
jgi:hypothetical protein